MADLRGARHGLAAVRPMRNSCGMLRFPPLIAMLCLVLAACEGEHGGIRVAPDWRVETIAECGDDRPDMQLLSADGRFLYQSCEGRTNLLTPSLARITLASGRRDILLYGLRRADGLRLAPDGSLWVGEEAPDGVIWRIHQPDSLAPEQRADRKRLTSSSNRVQPLMVAGRFAHEGIAFSADGRHAYLADEWKEGCVYRLRLRDNRLQVLHRVRGWLDITRPADARIQAERLHGRIFNRIEDMERLPDGRILMAETGSGRILALDDRGDVPVITILLSDTRIKHPDNLEWDARRGWLWITDDSRPSEVWAWDGRRLRRIAWYGGSELTGLESDPDGRIYLNLQHRWFRPALTLRLVGPA